MGSSEAAKSCSRTRAGSLPPPSRHAVQSACVDGECTGREAHGNAYKRQRRSRANHLRSRSGIKATIFCPEDTPDVNVHEISGQGASVYRVNGLIDDCGKIVAEGTAKVGWFDTSTLKEPSDRGQEDDGPRTCQTMRLGASRHDLLSDRRGDRPDRDVESLRRT